MDASSTESIFARSRRWSGRHRVALCVLAALVLLYALAGFVLVPRIARSSAIDYVQKQLGRHLSIEQVRFNPFTFTLEVRQLAFTEADQSPIASFALLRVEFAAWSSLLHRAWVFDEIHIEQPDVRALVHADGTLNLAQISPPASATAPPPPSTPAPLPALRINQFSMQRGQAQYEDRSRGQPFVARLSPIEFSLHDFRTQPNFQNRYQFDAVTSAGERLAWNGEFSLQPLGSNGEFSVTGLKAATIVSYLESLLPFAMPSGSFDLQGSYRFLATNNDLSLTLPSLKMHTLAIAPKGSTDAPWVQLPELEIADTSVQLAQRRVAVGQITLHDAQLQVWRAADGSLNLQQLMGPATPAPAGAATSATAPAAAPSAPWSVTLAKLAVENAAVAFADRSVTPTVQLKIAPLTLTLQNYSSASSPSQPLSFDLDTGLGEGGHVHSAGTLVLAPLSANVKTELKSFDLSVLQPYIAQQAALTLYQGHIGAQTQLVYVDTPTKAQPRLKLDASVEVDDLGTRDMASQSDFVTWRALQLSGVHYQQQPDSLSIDRVRTTGAYARVIIASNGALNVSQVLKSPGAAGASAPATPASAKAAAPAPARHGSSKAAPVSAPAAVTASAVPGLRMRIGRIDVEDGAANFTDHSIEPTFSTAMLALHGSIVGLSSDPSSRAQVTLDGNVDKYAPVSIKGQVNLLSAATFTDIGLDFSNMDLTTFNPYSGKFAGYNITKGKLTTQLHYRVENRKLDATHHVVLDQLEFGAATDSKQAVPLPIKLAVALLKDRNGVINLDLPVSGSLDDPSFHIGPIVWQLVKGLLVKIVTAPFALLGSLFGGGPQLDSVDFPVGLSTLDAAQTQKLTQLSKALVERPQLKLDIPLHTVGAADDAALEHAALEQALTASPPASAGTRRRGAKDSASAASPHLAALVALYRAQFQADPVYPAAPAAAAADSAAGAVAAGAPAAPSEAAQISWLEQQLLPKYAPSTDQRLALGRARADAAEAAVLANTELAPERVFLTERDSGGGSDAAVRMELKLQ